MAFKALYWSWLCPVLCLVYGEMKNLNRPWLLRQGMVIMCMLNKNFFYMPFCCNRIIKLVGGSSRRHSWLWPEKPPVLGEMDCKILTGVKGNGEERQSPWTVPLNGESDLQNSDHQKTACNIRGTLICLSWCLVSWCSNSHLCFNIEVSLLPL